MILKTTGVGMPRTGTSSLKAALEILGFDPCHHISICVNYPDVRTLAFLRSIYLLSPTARCRCSPRLVSKKRSLEYNFDKGWPKLCESLRVPVPKVPFSNG